MPNAVLAGDGAADRHAQLEYFAAQFLGAFQFPRLVGIVEYQRVQVAVAGMEYVADRQAVRRRQHPDLRQHLCQVPARDGAVHAVVVRREAAHGRKGSLASGPETLALRLVAGDTQIDRAGLREHRAGAFDLGRDILASSVQFAQQDRRRLFGITGVHESFHGADGRIVEQFETRRNDAGGDDGCDGGRGGFDGIESREHDLRRLRLRQQFDGHLGDDAKQSLRAGQQGQQVIARTVERFAADGQGLALDGQDLELLDVVHGEPVFEAMHAPGVFRHVAADGAGDLRGGVRGVIEAERLGRFRDGQIGHAGLDARGAIVDVDVEYPVEARQAEQHSVAQGQRAARQARAGAARDDGYMQLGA